MLQEDYQATLQQAGRSTYHEAAAIQLDALANQAPMELKIVDSVPGLLPDATREEDGAEAYTQLLEATRDPSNLQVGASDIVRLTADAYVDWIAYNERKLQYLRPDEKAAKKLRDGLDTWRSHLAGLDSISGDEDEILGEFLADSQNEGTLRQLVSACWRTIRLVDEVNYVHDPMLPEYLPMIDLLERLRSVPAEREDSDFNFFLESYRLRMKRYGEMIPLEWDQDEWWHQIEVFKDIRKRLEDVDTILGDVDEGDPAAAFVRAQTVIGPIVEEIRRSIKKLDWGVWVSSLLSPLVSLVGSPGVLARAQDEAAARVLARHHIGRFAGAYAMVVDDMVTGQRRFHGATSVAFQGDGSWSTFWHDPTKE